MIGSEKSTGNPWSIDDAASADEAPAGLDFVVINGRGPEPASGEPPSDFEGQCRCAWTNVLVTLQSAGMDVGNLVMVTTFLTHQDQVPVNRRVCREVLGKAPATYTVMVPKTNDPRWLIEIEAMASAS